MTHEEEYLEFLKQFNGGFPTNFEFFIAACNWQKEKDIAYIKENFGSNFYVIYDGLKNEGTPHTDS